MNNEPRRVLHMIASLELGGSQSMVMNLYRKIDRTKIQFDFIVDHTDSDTLREEIKSLGGKIFVLPTFKGINIIEIIRAWNHFFAEHPEYDILHTHSRSYASIYLPIAKKHGVVTIAHSHSSSNGRGVSAIIKNLLQFPIRYQADYLFACSDKAGRWLYGKKAIMNSNYCVIPNGIDLERFAFDEIIRCQMRQELGINEDAFVIGHVGRFTVPKNHKFLIDLFANFHKGNENSKLLLVGSGELFDSIKRQVDRLEISDAVILVGNRINTEDYYQAMDTFVFPSLWEGLGIVVVEAQANGLPCLISENVPREAVLTRNVKSLSLGFNNKWLDELNGMQINGRSMILENRIKEFDINVIAKRLQTFYLEQYEKENR